jgi:uncharacterized protein
MTITPYYAAALALLFVVLSVRVIMVRRSRQIGFGFRQDTGLERRIRIHANFAEYVPLALILMAMAEMRGASPLMVHGMGGLLVAARLAHAWGLSNARTDNLGRVLGVGGSLTVITAAAIRLVLH